MEIFKPYVMSCDSGISLMGIFMKIDIAIHQNCCDNRMSRGFARKAWLTLSRFASAIQAIAIRITATMVQKTEKIKSVLSGMFNHDLIRMLFRKCYFGNKGCK